MIDWNSRIDDLMHVLESQHGITDRLAVEALLSAMVSCPRTPAPWLILETNWYARECLGAWFSFGNTWVPSSLARLRSRSASWRATEGQMQQYLDSPNEERLFVEPEYEKYPPVNRRAQSQFLLHRSLRLRTRTMRGWGPLGALDQWEAERRADALAAATRGVLEDRLRSRPADPPAFRPPENFLYYVEMVQRLSPWYPDWNELVVPFGALAVRHAFLCGRTETGPEDAAAIARVAADSIPPWIANTLRLLYEEPRVIGTLERAMALGGKNREHSPRTELARLRRAGIIEYNQMKKHWLLAAAHRQGVVDLLEGRAFGSLAKCA